ncbi:MAG: hypothetical protein JW881_15640 [Spirochaetales bacterium]|nr:hypothetical protein [Spirochaetales bacterium]
MESPIIDEMMRIITSQWISAPLYTAVRLGIPDLLLDSSRSVTDLSRETGADESSLYRILRGLAHVGIFSEERDRIFSNTEKSRLLVSDSLAPIALMFLSEWHTDAMKMLCDGVLNGKCPFELAFGKDASTWLSQHPEAASIFNRANSIKTKSIVSSLLEAYDFSRIRTVTDIGGGTGGLLAGILSAYPSLSGTILELPHVIPQTRDEIGKAGLEKICGAVSFDFFNDVPESSDLFLLVNILHDWDDIRCGKLLDNCGKGMKRDTRLLVIEMLIPNSGNRSSAVFMDIEMLVMGNGRERTKDEFECLLVKSGLALSACIPCGDYHILECTLSDNT